MENDKVKPVSKTELKNDYGGNARRVPLLYCIDCRKPLEGIIELCDECAHYRAEVRRKLGKSKTSEK